jgi:prevent-host-death family protein
MIVNIHEAKTHFSRLVKRAMGGDEVIIGKAGKPVARLIPYREDDTPRVPGGWERRVWISEDFDELPAEVAAAFRGERP